MKNIILSENVSKHIFSLFQELRDNFLHPIGFMQLGAIGVSYLVAWLFAEKIRHFLEKDFDKVRGHMRIAVSPAHFAIILRNFFWALQVPAGVGLL